MKFLIILAILIMTLSCTSAQQQADHNHESTVTTNKSPEGKTKESKPKVKPTESFNDQGEEITTLFLEEGAVGELGAMEVRFNDFQQAEYVVEPGNTAYGLAAKLYIHDEDYHLVGQNSVIAFAPYLKWQVVEIKQEENQGIIKLQKLDYVPANQIYGGEITRLKQGTLGGIGEVDIINMYMNEGEYTLPDGTLKQGLVAELFIDDSRPENVVVGLGSVVEVEGEKWKVVEIEDALLTGTVILQKQ